MIEVSRAGQPWSGQDIEFLKTHYDARGGRWCAAMLKRRLIAVYNKAKVLGLHSGRGANISTGKLEASVFSSDQPRPLPRPTAAMPGTREKLDVLQQRALNGLALHHPQDRWLGAQN